MTTLLPILLAWGMHPAQTITTQTTQSSSGDCSSCIVVPAPTQYPGCTTGPNASCPSTIPPAPEKAAAPDEKWREQQEALIQADLRTLASEKKRLDALVAAHPDLFIQSPPHPKPKRKATDWDAWIALCRKLSDVSCLDSPLPGDNWVMLSDAEEQKLFTLDAKPKADPILTKVDAMDNRIDDLCVGGEGLASLLVGIVLIVIWIAWRQARIRADIINAILGGKP